MYDHGYSIYRKYKNLLDLLDKEELTVTQIVAKTRIPVGTVYGMIKPLLENNEIIAAGQQYSSITSQRKSQAFKRVQTLK